MRQVLFVDHAFHRRTRSSAFFLDLLHRQFAVTVLAVDPDRPDLHALRAPPGTEAVVLWQLDYLAPIFLGQGLRTLVLPMFDGSANLPDAHFLAARGAGFANFSRALHERVRMLGLPSHLLRYVPPPVAEAELPRFDVLRGFLWQRRPQDGIDIALVRTLFGDQLASLHVHDVPDDPQAPRAADPPDLPFPVTRSTWFEDAAGYRAQLACCNVFIAPRAAEGIGLAMLEAMARGMLVVAHDQPTHNEYVCNWVNGVLFNKDAPGAANFADAAAIARRGWQSVRDRHPQWLAQAAQIGGMLAALPSPQPLPPHRLDHLIRTLPHAFAAGPEAYARTLAGPASAAAPPAAPPAFAAGPGVEEDEAAAPLLAPARDAQGLGTIDFANSGARPYLREGWSFDEPAWVWAEGLRATLAFRLPHPADTDITLRCLAWTANAQHPAPLLVGVLLNGHFVQEVRPADMISAIVLRLPRFMLRDGADNTLEFVMSSVFAAANDRRRVSCAFCQMEFLPATEEPAAPFRSIESGHAAPAFEKA